MEEMSSRYPCFFCRRFEDLTEFPSCVYVLWDYLWQLASQGPLVGTEMRWRWFSYCAKDGDELLVMERVLLALGNWV